MNLDSMSETPCDNLIVPNWPAPANVRAFVTTRRGGASQAPFDGFNLAEHVEDDTAAVQVNRQRLMAQTGFADIQWLEQVHGTKVVEAQPDARVRTADACYSSLIGVACAVLTADCLPLLLCDKAGTQVAAVHAGWRSLAGGVICHTVKAFNCPANEILVYLGPAISQPHFEVGIEVLEAFFDAAKTPAQGEAVSAAFTASKHKPMHFCADLYSLARAELAMLGVSSVYGGDYCTVATPQSFYSFRRDGQTGRMASLIGLV